MSKAFYSGKKPVYELKLVSGRTIKASRNHPFRKLTGWAALETLAAGDRIATPKILPSNGEPSTLHWDEILSIEPLGMEDVYDATVEQVHNFVANGIIVHNSIEQDADLVMFVFRREYYNANDKPGMAELLVAKNRHGQVGEVKLAFRKHLAQFQNYTEEETFDPSKDDESFRSYSLN